MPPRWASIYAVDVHTYIWSIHYPKDSQRLITKVSNNCFFVQLRASRTTAVTAHSAQLATTEAHVAHHTAAAAVHQVHAWRLSGARGLHRCGGASVHSGHCSSNPRENPRVPGRWNEGERRSRRDATAALETVD